MLPEGLTELVEETKKEPIASTPVNASILIPENVDTDVHLMVKRIGTVLRHLPKGIQISDEAVAELAKMNRQQRRSAVARLKPSEKNKGKRSR